MGKVHIAELDCQRLRFQDGDRILVKIFEEVSPEINKHITKTIRRWAGREVEVLVYDGRGMEITVEKEWKKPWLGSSEIIISSNQ